MNRYEWRYGQLWDHEKQCWVILGGAVGMTEELKEKIAYLLNLNYEGNAYVEGLRVQNQHLVSKLIRILDITYADRNNSLTMAAVRDVALEQLPPSNPIAVETSRAEMLAEIDKTMQEAGVWIGGRLDSIKQLIEMVKPSWGAGDEYVANLREQWGQINELVEKSVGRTKGQSLVYDVARLVDDMGSSKKICDDLRLVLLNHRYQTTVEPKPTEKQR